MKGSKLTRSATFDSRGISMPLSYESEVLNLKSFIMGVVEFRTISQGKLMGKYRISL